MHFKMAAVAAMLDILSTWVFEGNGLAIFDLHVTLLLPIKYPVNWPFGSGEEVQNRWRPSLISDENDLS